MTFGVSFNLNGFLAMKTILVPTDFSPVSLQALDVAVGLARTNAASIYLLDVVKYPETVVTFDAALAGEHPDDVFEELVEGVENRLRSLVDQPKYAGVRILPAVQRETASVGETIANQPVDLIVMGSEGASGWKEFTTGSNAEKVVRFAKAPVLVVKNAPLTPFERVVVPTDFSDTEFIRKALRLLHLQNAYFVFLTIDTGMKLPDYDELRQRANALIGNLNLPSADFEIVGAPTEALGIENFVRTYNPDLVVMNTHGRTGMAHFVHGSVAEKVVNHVECPVLTYLV